jgi:hypothetical protein
VAHSIDPSDVHYRLIEAPNGEAAVACVQDFDYPGYTFITEDLHATQEEAVAAARKLRDPREILADIIYRNSYPDPTSPRIQPLAERARWEQEMVYRTVDSIIAAGFVQV